MAFSLNLVSDKGVLGGQRGERAKGATEKVFGGFRSL
jgi:hypothetical protein